MIIEILPHALRALLAPVAPRSSKPAPKPGAPNAIHNKKKMSLSASAASAVLTVLADKTDGGSERRWEDQLKEQRDLYTQFVISSALGLSAFLTFCVCFHLNIDTIGVC